MITYISGPMTGMPELNFPAFHDAAARLRAAGRTVINPAEICTAIGLQWSDYMRKDLAELVKCDVIHMLPGWQQSKGARLELYVATELGMIVEYGE